MKFALALVLVLLASSCSSAKAPVRYCLTSNGECIDFDLDVSNALSDSGAASMCAAEPGGDLRADGASGCRDIARAGGGSYVGSCALGYEDVVYFDLYAPGEAGARTDCADRGGLFTP